MLGKDRQVRRLGLLVAGLLVATTAACSDGSPRAEAPTTAPPTTAAPTPPRPDPKVGSCHDLSFTEATEAVTEGGTVRCRRPHTAVTFAVGQLDLLVDGHLLAMDSNAVSDQLDDKCGRGLQEWLGGSLEDLRLSRFRDVWFRPGVQEADRGATWYRCDVVAVAQEGELVSFRGDLKGALDADDALDRWGTCGTSSPTREDFRKVVCTEQHRWRATSIVEFPERTKYLGKGASRAADTACQDEATSRVNESLEYEWAFQWPTREEWDGGQRYGWCWLPADA